MHLISLARFVSDSNFLYLFPVYSHDVRFKPPLQERHFNTTTCRSGVIVYFDLENVLECSITPNYKLHS